MEAANWDNGECIPSPQEMVASRIGGKFAPVRANFSTHSSEEIA